MKLFNFLRTNKKSEEKYFDFITKENSEKCYSVDKKYMNQDMKLLKMYNKANTYNKKIKIIAISDTHGRLNEKNFKDFMQNHEEYDVCLLLGDHDFNDIAIILKYVEKNKIYGLLGNHDYNYLEKFNINNLNGKVIDINGTTILGIQGSFKYKPAEFPSFTQKESILFLNNKPSVDILVSHDNRFDSSTNKNNAHQGLFGITYYLFKNTVPYHIHGHIHESYNKQLINGTKEISIYMYEYIELN